MRGNEEREERGGEGRARGGGRERGRRKREEWGWRERVMRQALEADVDDGNGFTLLEAGGGA